MSTFLSHWYLHTECHFIKSTEYALQRHSSFNFSSLSPVMYTHHTWHEIKTLFICKCTISSCFVPRVLLMWYSLHNSRPTVLGVWYAPKPNIFSFLRHSALFTWSLFAISYQHRNWTTTYAYCVTGYKSCGCKPYPSLQFQTLLSGARY